MKPTVRRVSLCIALALVATAGAEQPEDSDKVVDSLPAQDEAPAFTVTLPTDKGERWPVSHTIGYQLGLRIRNDIPDLDIDAFTSAFRSALTGNAPQLDEAQMRKALDDYQQARMHQVEEENRRLAAANLSASQSFLDGIGKRKGVKTTASGLRYEVLRKGKGDSPTKNDVVKVHYHGTLADGTVFDSSRDGDPAEFPLGSVIAGWVEGLQLMNRGAQYRLYVPADLAYGERGAGDRIAPNQALVFEVELLDFHAFEGTDLNHAH